MVTTEITPITFQYSHTIGRQENRSGSGFFYPVDIVRSGKDQLSVISRGSETPAFFPCKRVTVFTVNEELVQEFGQKIPPEEADENAPAGTFMWPTALTVDSEGSTYVADEWLQRITVFDKDGECKGTWGKVGSGDGEFNKPSGLACGANDNIYVVDSYNHRVQIFAKDGKYLSQFGTEGNGDGQFSYPWGVEIDYDGNVWVADWRNDRIQKFTPEGQFLMKFGSTGDGDGQLNRPTKVAVDKEGIIYVADFKNDRLQVFDAEGNFITKLLGEATLSKWGRERVELDPTIVRAREMAHNLHEREKLFHGPISIEVDDEGRIYVLECPRQRLQIYRKQKAIFAGGVL